MHTIISPGTRGVTARSSNLRDLSRKLVTSEKFEKSKQIKRRYMLAWWFVLKGFR